METIQNNKNINTSLRDRILGIRVTSVAGLVFGTIVLFSALFEFPLIGALTSRKLCLAACLIYLFFKRKGCKEIFDNINKARVSIFLACLLICFFISLWNSVSISSFGNNVYIEPYYYLQVIVYTLVFSTSFVLLFRNVKYFAYSYIAIMLFESVVVFIAASDSSFRLMLYDNFYVGDDRFDSTIMWGTRIIGVFLHSSTGSIILAIACILLIYLRFNKSMSVMPFIVFYAIITSATFLIGRTGFYLELALFVLYLFMEKRVSSKVIILIGVAIVLFFVINGVLSGLNSNISNLIFNWATELFNEETRTNTISNLASMSIPPFSLELIFGTNISLGTLPNGELMTSDSGYAKTYCEIGIVGFVFFYVGLSALLTSFKFKFLSRRGIFISVILLVAFILEIKEPYFLKYVYLIAIFTLLLFVSSESSLIESEK